MLESYSKPASFKISKAQMDASVIEKSGALNPYTGLDIIFSKFLLEEINLLLN